MNPIAFRVEESDPDGPDARWCLEQYYGELRLRFAEGFDPGRSLLADPGEMRRPRGVFLVARQGERPVGCGVVKVTSPGVGYVKRMWVDPGHRGQGVGRGLLRALEGAAAELGCTTVQLETNRVLTGAIALYRSEGYLEVAPFNDEFYAHHWFQKELPGEGARGSALQVPPHDLA